MLSYHQAVNVYFPDKSTRLCGATPYAAEKDSGITRANGYFWWWLRSPGKNQNGPAIVLWDGRIDYDIYDGCSGAVRPAIWIDTRKLPRKDEPVHVTPENIDLMNIGNVLFMSAASGGAMGEPGVIYLANKNNEWFRLNSFRFTDNQLKSIPVIRDILFTSDGQAAADWMNIYLGMGNNLFIHKSIFDEFRQLIRGASATESYGRWQFVARTLLEKHKTK